MNFKSLLAIALLFSTQAFAALPPTLSGTIVLKGVTSPITISPDAGVQAYIGGTVKIGDEAYKIESADTSADGRILAAGQVKGADGESAFTLTIFRDKDHLDTIRTNLSSLGFTNDLLEIKGDAQSNAFVIKTDQSNGANVGNWVQFKAN